MIRCATYSVLLALAPLAAFAHQLTVFASVDCEVIRVEAKFSNGKAVQQGDVRVLGADNAVLSVLSLRSDGTADVPLDSVDHSGGLQIEVASGHHDNYWIVTPDDIARSCPS